MIVGSIELRSAITSERDRVLATIVIANDGSGDGRSGNYTVTVQRPGGRPRSTGVARFPRSSRSVLELLRRGLNGLADLGELP